MPSVTEIDRAFEPLALAAIDVLIGMPACFALLEEGDPPRHKRHKLCFWRGILLCEQHIVAELSAIDSLAN